MKKKSLLLLIISTLLLTNNSLPVFAFQSAKSDEYNSEQIVSNDSIESNNGDFVPGQVIVGMAQIMQTFNSTSTLFSGLDVVTVESLTDNKGIIVKNSLTRSATRQEIVLLQLAEQSRQSVLDAIDILKDNPNIAYAEPNYICSTEQVPNDPQFSSLWGMKNIQAKKAWDTTTGSRSVLVGVLDTGVDVDHPDLKNNVNTSLAKDFTNSSVAYRDIDGHGTHVAGTIGAEGNNRIGVTGINWNVSIVSIKVLGDDGYGTTSQVINGINYAASQKIPIINMSLGGGSFSQAEKNAIDAYPGLIVAAAGNDKRSNDTTPHYPSDYDSNNIISVAASDMYDNLSDFLNYGVTRVDLAAPGTAILSTVPGAGYDSWQGTSMATPHVAGAAALLKSYYPNLSTAQLKSKILDNVEKTNGLKGKVATGGRLNLDFFNISPVKKSDVNSDGFSDYIMPYKNANGLIAFISFFAKGDGTFQDGIGTNSDHFPFVIDSIGKGKGMMADVNGDGQIDYIMTDRADDEMTSLITFLSNGKGQFTEGRYWKSNYFGFTFDTTGQGTGKMADVNNDGYADYIMPHRTAKGMIGFVTFLATGDGSFREGIGSQSDSFGFVTDSTGQGTGIMADVNGDRYNDYVMPVAASDGKTALVTFLSKGDGTFTDGFNSKSKLFGFTSDSTGQGTGKMADVNKDGFADYIMPYKTANNTIGFITFLANGDGTFREGIDFQSASFGFTTDSTGQGTGIMADVNGDGCQDYIMPVRTSDGMTGLVAFLAKGNGTFTDGFYSKSNYFGFTSNSLGQGTGKMADVNNDGYADYIMPYKTAKGLIGFITFFANGNGTFRDGIGSQSDYFGFVSDSTGQGTGFIK